MSIRLIGIITLFLIFSSCGEKKENRPDHIWDAVFQKFETNLAEYDSNYSYYLNHPKELEKVYEQVIINLNEASGELEKETKK